MCFFNNSLCFLCFNSSIVLKLYSLVNSDAQQIRRLFKSFLIACPALLKKLGSPWDCYSNCTKLNIKYRLPYFIACCLFLLHTDYVFAVKITEKPQTLYDCAHCMRHIIIMNTKQVLTALIVYIQNKSIPFLLNK